MYDADSTRDHELTTEQIASAGTAPARQDMPTPSEPDMPTPSEPDVPTPADNEDDGYDHAAPVVADHASSGQAWRGAPETGNGASVPADPGQHGDLLEVGELQGITARWKDIQAEFVEEPTVAVRHADALVAELMQRLAVVFAAERAELESRWAGENEVSTEDLRQGMRRYRTFVERLLAA